MLLFCQMNHRPNSAFRVKVSRSLNQVIVIPKKIGLYTKVQRKRQGKFIVFHKNRKLMSSMVLVWLLRKTFEKSFAPFYRQTSPKFSIWNRKETTWWDWGVWSSPFRSPFLMAQFIQKSQYSLDEKSMAEYSDTI